MRKKKKKGRCLLVLLVVLSFSIALYGCNKDKACFLEALQKDDWEAAQAVLDTHHNLVNLRLESGGTLLHAAVYYDNKEMLEFLLKNGLDVNSKSKKNEETALHSAALQGRHYMAKLLLDNGADVNACDEFMRTPLHDAAQFSNKEMVELLIIHGATVDAKAGLYDRTPLYYACVNRGEDKDALEVVEILLKNGADPNAPCTPRGSTIIEFTTMADNAYFNKAQLLENYGAKLKLETNEGIKVFTVKEAQEIYEGQFGQRSARDIRDN